MIYTVITNIEKMDCRALRQSEVFISKNIIGYIENTSNQAQKKARFCAYASLFFALRDIYAEKNADICFSEDGKPYLINCDKKIYISISHCNTLSAVCLSDNGEIGIDIQDEIDAVRAMRLQNRFFTNLNFKNNLKSENKIFVFQFCEDKFTLTEGNESHLNFNDNVGDFTEKWSLAESLLKCQGTGFGGAADVIEIQKSCYSSTVRLMAENKAFALSISIKKTIM